ncbi:(5-formylfuran-3-yl)methyl phosphate synthase [Methylonatrum kenyense]|uniref:(5-formylfuran-3-yl)methyl phosphate synthase n=1 Tax=Methylonatrum kenyense TaxID=455253 RepID=UPI0020C09B06|nr:(5-formylfuran-3-yl)methyl phosphate synthase [Methylonatrum kenyense]MCK8515436.1 (5-formylfuran-3-yl)methyl phosphate synthase [Methylonatrum kenyense]
MAADTRKRLKLLASVRDMDEVDIVLDAGVDLIDMKEPSRGALGAVDPPMIRDAVCRVNGRTLTSATIGDTPLPAAGLTERVRAIGDCGVDFVKIGLRMDQQLEACLEALAPLARRYHLVAVWLADHGVPGDSEMADLATSDFAGAMLDTADKSHGALPELLSNREIAAFVTTSRRHGLLTGLAGSLRLSDIPGLAPFGADYLGFRGGLCNGDRRGRLDPKQVRDAVLRISDSGASAALPATAS